MANLNRVFLIGRLTRDPEQRFIPSGQAVVQIGIAVNRQFTTNGEKREETTFVDAEAWGQPGEMIHRYLRKGSPLFVEGRLKFDSWETKEGEKRSKLRVVVERFQFLGGGQGENRQTGEPNIDPAEFGIDPGSAPGGSADAGFDGGGGGAGGGGAGGGGAGGGESDVPF